MKHMNRIIVLSALLLSSTAHAGWGILGGLNFYNVKDSGVDTSSAIMGGLAFEGRMAPGLGLEADILYVKNKTSGSSDFGAVQVPVLLRLRLLPLLSIGAGGYVSYALENVPATKKTDLGALGSARIALPLGACHLTLEGRYLLGLTNNFDGSGGGEVKTRSIQALAGLMFGI